MARKSKRQQRLEMIKMQNKKNLQVTFSKRRTELFKKASELCTLYGIYIAIVCFSPVKKVFSFGYPSIDAILERFLGHDDDYQQPMNENGGVLAMGQLIEGDQNDKVCELNMELANLEGMIEIEKKRSESIDNIVEANRGAQRWRRGPYDEFDMDQLLTLKNAMKNLSNCINEKVQLMVMLENGFPFSLLAISNSNSENILFSPRNGLGLSTHPSAFRPPLFDYSHVEDSFFRLNFNNCGCNSDNDIARALPLTTIAASKVNTSMANTSDNVFISMEASTSYASKSGANSSMYPCLRSKM